MDIEQKLIDLICKQRDVFREEYKSIFKQLDKKHLNTEHSSTEFNYLLSEICGSSNTRQMIVAAICKVAAVTTNTSQLYINTSNAEDSLWELINNTSMTESQRNDVKSMQNRLKPIQSRQNSLAELLLGDTSAEASHKYDSDSDTSYNDSFGDQINKFLGLHVSSKEAATAETPYEDDFEDKSPDKQLPKIDIADESPYEDDFEDKSPDKQLLKIDIPDESPYGDDFEDKSPNKQLQGARLSHVADEDKSVVAKQCSHSSVDDDIMMRDADDVLAASLLTPAAVASKSSVAVSPQDTYESSLEFSKSFTPNTAAAATTTTTYMNSNNPTTTTIDATPDVEHSLDNFELAWSNHITTSTAVKPTIDTPPNNDIITTSPPAAATTTCNAQSSTSLKTAALIQRPTSATVTSVTKSQSSLRPKSAASATKPSSQMHRSKSASDYLSSGSGRIYTKSALPACARSKRPISAAPQSTPPPKPPVPVFRKPSQFVSKLKTITNKKFDLADIAEMQLEQPKTITTTKDLYQYIESKVNYIREVQPVVEQVWTDRIREALEVSIEQKEKQHADELSALKRQLESRQQNQQFTNLIATANKLRNSWVPAYVKIPSETEVERAKHVLDVAEKHYFYEDKKSMNDLIEKHRLEMIQLRSNVDKPIDAIAKMFAKQLTIVVSAQQRAHNAATHATNLLDAYKNSKRSQTALIRAHNASSDAVTVLLTSLNQIETEITSLNTTIRALKDPNNSSSTVLSYAPPSPSRVDTTRPKSALLRKYSPVATTRRPKSAISHKPKAEQNAAEDSEVGIYEDDFDAEPQKTLTPSASGAYSNDFDDTAVANNDYYISDDEAVMTKNPPPPTAKQVQFSSNGRKKLKKFNKRRCSECNKRFRGKGRVLPTALKTKDGTWMQANKDENIFSNTKQLNYMSLLQTQQEPYGAKIGLDKLFCSWCCAKEWNNKHTCVQKRYQTNTLIDIASGSFKQEF